MSTAVEGRLEETALSNNHQGLHVRKAKEQKTSELRDRSLPRKMIRVLARIVHDAHAGL